ncbi:putative HD superfamily hydrolase involved in NAD metabolism [Hydrogenispora ethanolica]|uniref:bis(5'-nucleosyl)-tetraphosphatase (symmetrical) n=1 Tax=Hydrogenispora ethanolica TaxID=1082276 RepID=A0A4R1QWG5_HYDET|nr:bis(5'-nucleosyl)-tetraphosphatase (symmetrical) YqeK [Hydrogenispora ethanolica]TCL57115.1 putative HD superfamily hydrolase involved in NAD metabolism [Hydrogenispora ethanolica]
MDRTEIINYLKEHVSSARFQHCLGVEKTALELTSMFGTAPEQASPAALLHDLCREYAPDSLLQLATNFGIVIDDIQRAEPLLLHGLVGAELVRRELGITEPSVLEAISFHITGAANLTPLARSIFVADFIEPGRSFEYARELRRKLPMLSADQLLLRVYNQTICYVVNRGYLIDPKTVEGRNELVFKGVQ